MDLSLDPITHDLTLTAGHVDTVEDVEEVKQRCKVALLTHREEWAFDLSFGMPYRQVMSQKPPRPGAIRAAVAQVLGRVRGVTEVVRVAVQVDQRTREATLTATVKAGAITTEVTL